MACNSLRNNCEHLCWYLWCGLGLIVSAWESRRHDCVCEAAGAGWRDPFVHHCKLQDAFDCVSPVVYKNQCIGHILVEAGKFLQTTAFGGPSLKLVVSFPFLDIVLLKGRQHFYHPASVLVRGGPSSTSGMLCDTWDCRVCSCKRTV